MNTFFKSTMQLFILKVILNQRIMSNILQNIKKTSDGVKLAYNVKTKDIYPWFVNFRITYRCNYRCHYCDSPNKNIKEMTTDEIKRMIRELKALGLRKLAFSGGEPLIRRDLGELISYCKEYDVFTNIVSNGSLFPKHYKELKDVNYMCFSLDGTQVVNDAIRGKGAYARVIKSVKIAQDMKYKYKP